MAKINALCYEKESHVGVFLRILWEFDGVEMERVMIVAWAIWRHRNQVVWERKASSVAQVVFHATSYFAEWKEARVHPQQVRNSESCSFGILLQIRS